MPERVLTRFDDDAKKDEAIPQSKPYNAHQGKKRKREESGAHRQTTSPFAQEAEKQEIPLSNRVDRRPSSPQSHSSTFSSNPTCPPVRTTIKIHPRNGASKHSHSHQNGNQPNLSANDSLKARARILLPQCRALPIWSHASSIRQGLLAKDIMLLVGETGSGKSTQVPQMLLQEPWFKSKTLPNGTKIGGCIAVTEPRRVAAISLARRVAEEMATPLGAGSPASKVGYSVRFDNSTSPATQVKYLTEGMLLQEMLRDPYLRQYSAVVVDEVHERGVNVDLVLGFLRRMVVEGEGMDERGGVGMKVCVMSATAEVEKLGEFFRPAKRDISASDFASGHTNGHKNGQNGHVNGTKRPFHSDGGAESESEWSGISSDEDQSHHQSIKSDSAINSKGVNGSGHHQSHADNAQRDTQPPSNVATCYIEGRQHPVSIHYTPTPVADFVDASLRAVFQIHHAEPMPGDILVFLTGQEVVESLESLINEHALGLSRDVPRMVVLPLFAALPQPAQQKVFQPAPSGTRKVILSTNIAETSVTVPGVRFVIDSGKAKTKHFRTSISLESLLVKPISKSSAIQRTGRAGREAPGKCYRLYTESTYLALDAAPTPEILRSDLSHAILTLKARQIDSIVDFPFLSPPPRDALEKALLLLFQLGTLTPSGAISPTGTRMAALPLPAKLSRALIAAGEMPTPVVEEVVDIIACLTVENVFLNANSDERKEAAETARRALYRREGDHLTLLATLRAYAGERTDRKGWCERHWVSHRAMRSVMDVRKQLRGLCRLSSPPEGAHAHAEASISAERATAVLKAFLRGFIMSTARLVAMVPGGEGGGGQGYRTVVGNQSVGIHPGSVLFGRKVECVMYNEFVFTNKAYARGCSVVQMDWIQEIVGQGESDGLS